MGFTLDSTRVAGFINPGPLCMVLLHFIWLVFLICAGNANSDSTPLCGQNSILIFHNSTAINWAPVMYEALLWMLVTAVNQRGKRPCPHEAYIFRGYRVSYPGLQEESKLFCQFWVVVVFLTYLDWQHWKSSVSGRAVSSISPSWVDSRPQNHLPMGTLSMQDICLEPYPLVLVSRSYITLTCYGFSLSSPTVSVSLTFELSNLLRSFLLFSTSQGIHRAWK